MRQGFGRPGSTIQDARGTSAKHGLADAITRANLYTEAGADAALVQGPRSTYEIQTIAKNTKGLRAVSISEGGLTPLHSYQQLKEMGFQLVRSLLTAVGCQMGDNAAMICLMRSVT